MLRFVDEEGLYEDAVFQDKRTPPKPDPQIITPPGPLLVDPQIITPPGPMESEVIPL